MPSKVMVTTKHVESRYYNYRTNFLTKVEAQTLFDHLHTRVMEVTNGKPGNSRFAGIKEPRLVVYFKEDEKDGLVDANHHEYTYSHKKI